MIFIFLQLKDNVSIHLIAFKYNDKRANYYFYVTFRPSYPPTEG